MSQLLNWIKPSSEKLIENDMSRRGALYPTTTHTTPTFGTRRPSNHQMTLTDMARD